MSENQTPATTTLAGLLDRALSARLAGIHTGAVGVVRAYNASNQTCDVQPVVRGRYEEGESFKFPLLVGVPVRFPSGGGYALTFPLQAGDHVWLDFGERSLDEWLALGGNDTEPRSARRFDLADAVAYPGIRPRSAPLSSASSIDLKLGQDSSSGLQLVVGPSGVSLGDDTSDVIKILGELIGEINSPDPIIIIDPVSNTGTFMPNVLLKLTELQVLINRITR